MNRFFFKWNAPIPLTLSVMVTAILFMIGIHIGSNNGMLPWRTVAVALLFFTIANQVGGLLVNNWLRYLLVSYLCMIALVVGLLIAAGQLSTLPLGGLVFMKRIYALLIFFYVLVTGLAGVFRVIHFLLRTSDDMGDRGIYK